MRGLELVLALVLLLSAGCERTPYQEFTPQLVVHAMLLSGTRMISVDVNRTYRIEEPFDSLFPGAEVLVARGQDTWRLEYANLKDRYHVMMEEGDAIRPSDTFTVRVSRPGFDTVYGRTVVPGGFDILYPAEGQQVSTRDSFGLTLPRHAPGIFLPLVREQQGERFYIDFSVAVDSFIPDWDTTRIDIRPMFFLYGSSPAPDPTVLNIYALDTNYFDWVQAGGFGMGGGGSVLDSRLSGGLGVFGSASIRPLTVYYRPDTTGPR